MKVSDKIIVTIDSLDHQGRGIAHRDNYVIFIFGVLIGEVVEVEISKIKKNIVEAEVVQILEKSKERVSNICSYFGICGGCDLLHMPYHKQLEYKERKVKEIMKKFAGLENVVAPIISNFDVFGYRNKVIFQVNEKIGFYKKKSNDIIPIQKCLLLPDDINEQLVLIQNHMDLHYVKQVMIRKSATTGKILILFDVENQFQENQIIKELQKFSIFIRKNKKVTCLFGTPFLIEHIGNFLFKISPDSFFQVNTKEMEKLYQEVLQKCTCNGTEKVLDLYCGTGTIGIFLSPYVKEVLGIEINPIAIEDAFWNKEQNHISNIRFLCGDTGTVLRKTEFEPDIVVVDPPRAGLDEKAILELQKISASTILYVSCDPVTLARDLKRLESMYEVLSVTPVDMFSNTYHVECVCLLNLR